MGERAGLVGRFADGRVDAKPGAPSGRGGSDRQGRSDRRSAAAPPGGGIVQTTAPTPGPNAAGSIRIPIPKNAPGGPRRVPIQAGHWKSHEAPDELRRVIPHT